MFACKPLASQPDHQTTKETTVKTSAKTLAARRTLAALRAHYTRTEGALRQMRDRNVSRAHRAPFVNKLTDLSARIEKLEGQRGVL